MAYDSVPQLISNSQIIVCIGTGGVGKTSISASLGACAALMGLRVLVLTIDPAQRLKSTLGLTPGQIAEIKHSEFRGKLFGSTVEAQEVFDQFVQNFSKDPETINKLKKNKLYQQLTTELSGSQEFSSLEKLYSEYRSQKYDLIVLDTPPAQHVQDFLNAPQKLAALFNENVTKWFRQNSRDNRRVSLLQSVFTQGTQQVIGVLEKLTGSDFMSELSDFFMNVQDWQAELERHIFEIHQLLSSAKTSFVLVTNFSDDKVKEAQQYAREIQKGGFHLRAILFNRALVFKNNEINEYSENNGEFQGLLPENKNIKEEKLYNNFMSMIGQQERQIDKIKNELLTLRSETQLLKIPEQGENIYNLEGVIQLARSLKEDNIK